VTQDPGVGEGRTRAGGDGVVKNTLEMVISAVARSRVWSGIDKWDADLEINPKWHRKDRLTIGGSRRGINSTFFEAHFRIRRDGIGLAFSLGDEHGFHSGQWSELVMKGGNWSQTAAESAIWACIFFHAVPKEVHRASLGMPILQRTVPKYGGDETIQIRELYYSDVKTLQEKLRKCSVAAYRPSDVPPCVSKALKLLRGRFSDLTGLDVKEAIQGLDKTFRFLHSRGVPFDRVKTAWDEAGVAEVMEG